MTIILPVIAFAAVIGLNILAVEYADRRRHREREELRREIERRERAHQPRKELRRTYVEATRRELLS